MTHSENNSLDWSDGEPPRPEPIDIFHVGIATQHQTSIACPEQYQGTLVDGRTFYFRYPGYTTEELIGPEDMPGVGA